MITVQSMGWPGLDLVEVENLRKCFYQKLSQQRRRRNNDCADRM